MTDDTPGAPAARDQRRDRRGHPMTDANEPAIPPGVDPQALNAQLMAEIRIALAEKDLKGRELRDKIGEITDEPAVSSMWTYRRLRSGEVPLVRGRRIIPAEVNPDLELIAKALGTTAQALIEKATDAIERATQSPDA
jgi:hypothetical protein